MRKFLLSIITIMALMPMTVKAQEITVGEATDARNLAPFVNSYPHSWCEMIYEASEIGQAFTIGSMAFNYAGGPQFSTNEIKIYLAETTKSEFASKSEWTAEDELTLVYSGTDVVLGDDEWETFEFNTPFEYGGEKNLAVVVSKTAPKNEMTLTWSCYDDANSVMFTASDTDASFAQYPAGEGLATYGKKPIMKLAAPSEEPEAPATLEAPTNLRAIVEQDLPDYPNYKYRITMMWDPVEGAEGYDVFVNTATATDFHMGYVNGTTYVAGSDKEATLEFYVVAFNEDTESEPSETYTITIVDDAIEDLTSSFNIYPNPVENQLFLATELNVEEVAIYDIYGRQQAVSCQLSAVSSIDVANLKAGVYFVKVKTNDGETVKRFVKE